MSGITHAANRAEPSTVAFLPIASAVATIAIGNANRESAIDRMATGRMEPNLRAIHARQAASTAETTRIPAASPGRRLTFCA